MTVAEVRAKWEATMQNVTLPDGDEVDAERTFGDLLPHPFLRLRDGQFTPEMQLAQVRAEMAEIKAWARALYAKQGEDCPLFKGEE